MKLSFRPYEVQRYQISKILSLPFLGYMYTTMVSCKSSPCIHATDLFDAGDRNGGAYEVDEEHRSENHFATIAGCASFNARLQVVPAHTPVDSAQKVS